MDATVEQLTRIETKLDMAIARLDDHEARLRSLEGRSGKRWEAAFGEGLKLAVAAAGGFVLSRLGL